MRKGPWGAFPFILASRLREKQVLGLVSRFFPRGGWKREHPLLGKSKFSEIVAFLARDPALPTTITPFLMFEGQAEEAMEFYVSLFPQSRVIQVERYCPAEMGREGSIKRAEFSLAGRNHYCIDSPVKHGFGFTPSLSLFVDLESSEEFDRLYGALSQNGKALMPPGDYGFGRKFAWLNDRFGVSWQLLWV